MCWLASPFSSLVLWVYWFDWLTSFFGSFSFTGVLVLLLIVYIFSFNYLFLNGFLVLFMYQTCVIGTPRFVVV